ncbi:succinyl-diaminopimelate desuccinylase [Acuticoccus sp.]|uniref:succinyl-diaminopimelate desuccinylase n=1 Tax=Acuticoccus sp. TaxID=1904378 RepID=UPI003B517091
MIDPLALARALIRVPSVTPAGPEVFDVVERALRDAGFEVTRMTFASAGTGVENLFATRGMGRHLAFAGHLDVVPPGAADAWSSPPYAATVDGDALVGRGAQDMKGGVAAIIAATARWASDGGPGRVSLLLTGDEEGPAVDGTRPLVEWVCARHPIDAAVVGEPTSLERLGDTLKVGRRGSLSATVTICGRQGHVAYQERADSPVPALLSVGQALLAPLDEGTPVFSPSNLEIVGIEVANLAWNVIPATASLRFNVRYNDRWSPDTLRAELTQRITRAASRPVDVAWEDGVSEAFVTRDEALIEAVSDAVEEATGVRPEQSTSGGTSDARFLKDYFPVVEFGAVGDTMHQPNERTSVAELRTLASAYRAIIDRVIGGERLPPRRG